MKTINNISLLTVLEDTRDLLCAFRRDHPDDLQPNVDDVLRTGLVWIERAKAVENEPDALDLLQSWMDGGECFCTSDGIAARGRCSYCKTLEYFERNKVRPE